MADSGDEPTREHSSAEQRGDLTRAAANLVFALDPKLLESTRAMIHTSRARNAGLLPSLGTVGDPYDNPVVESFWARMQVELLNRRRWVTRVELANAIFEYIEGFHNRRRRHGALGGTPR